ncbi:hypothetical protein QQ045_003416 [Rhodiola kirilowii]
MSETRSATTFDSLISLSASYSGLISRQQTLGERIQNQTAAIQRQAEESARNSAAVERMMEMVEKLQLPRAHKQTTEAQPPLLPTPTPPPIKPVNGTTTTSDSPLLATPTRKALSESELESKADGFHLSPVRAEGSNEDDQVSSDVKETSDSILHPSQISIQYVHNDKKQWSLKLILGSDIELMIIVHYIREGKQCASKNITSIVLIKMGELTEVYHCISGRRNPLDIVTAYFNGSKRQLTKNKGVIVGLNMVIINEPTTSVIAYGVNKKATSNGENSIQILYLGGGDVSLLTIEESILESKDSDDAIHIGGEDYDSKMINQFYPELGKYNIIESLKVQQHITDFNKANMYISSTTQTTIEVDTVNDIPGVVIVVYTWPKDYGDPSKRKDLSTLLRGAATSVSSDEKAILREVAESLLEAGVDLWEGSGYPEWIRSVVWGLQILLNDENFKGFWMANSQTSHNIIWSVASYKFSYENSWLLGIYHWDLIHFWGHFSLLIIKRSRNKLEVEEWTFRPCGRKLAAEKMMELSLEHEQTMFVSSLSYSDVELDDGSEPFWRDTRRLVKVSLLQDSIYAPIFEFVPDALIEPRFVIIVVDIGLCDMWTDIWKEQLNLLNKYQDEVQFISMIIHDTSTDAHVELPMNLYYPTVDESLCKVKMSQIPNTFINERTLDAQSETARFKQEVFATQVTKWDIAVGFGSPAMNPLYHLSFWFSSPRPPESNEGKSSLSLLERTFAGSFIITDRCLKWLSFAHRVRSWNLLRRIKVNSRLSWLVLGDFNEITCSDEMQGGRPRQVWQMENFRSTLSDCGLVDLGFEGYPFTFSNRRGGDEEVKARLDRGVATMDWKNSFPRTVVSHVQLHASDHQLLILDTEKKCVMRRKKLFRFEVMWFDHPEFAGIMNEFWDRMGSENTRWWSKLRCCKEMLRDWNMSSFGNVQKRISSLKEKLQVIREARRSPEKIKEEKRITEELDNWLAREEAL